MLANIFSLSPFLKISYIASHTIITFTLYSENIKCRKGVNSFEKTTRIFKIKKC